MSNIHPATGESIPPDSNSSTRPVTPVGKPPGPGTLSANTNACSYPISTPTVKVGSWTSTGSASAPTMAAPTSFDVSIEPIGYRLSARRDSTLNVGLTCLAASSRATSTAALAMASNSRAHHLRRRQADDAEHPLERARQPARAPLAGPHHQPAMRALDARPRHRLDGASQRSRTSARSKKPRLSPFKKISPQRTSTTSL